MEKKNDKVERFNKALRNTGCCTALAVVFCAATTAAACIGWQWLVLVGFIGALVCAIAAAVWSAITDSRNPSTWTPAD